MTLPSVEIEGFQSEHGVLTAAVNNLCYVRIQPVGNQRSQIFLRFKLVERVSNVGLRSWTYGLVPLWLPDVGPKSFNTENPAELTGYLEPLRAAHQKKIQGVVRRVEDWPACWFVLFSHPELNRMPVITNNPKLKGARVLKWL